MTTSFLSNRVPYYTMSIIFYELSNYSGESGIRFQKVANEDGSPIQFCSFVNKSSEFLANINDNNWNRGLVVMTKGDAARIKEYTRQIADGLTMSKELYTKERMAPCVITSRSNFVKPKVFGWTKIHKLNSDSPRETLFELDTFDGDFIAARTAATEEIVSPTELPGIAVCQISGVWFKTAPNTEKPNEPLWGLSISLVHFIIMEGKAHEAGAFRARVLNSRCVVMNDGGNKNKTYFKMPPYSASKRKPLTDEQKAENKKRWEEKYAAMTEDEKKEYDQKRDARIKKLKEAREMKIVGKVEVAPL